MPEAHPNFVSRLVSYLENSFSFQISICLTCSFLPLAHGHPTIPMGKSSPTDQETNTLLLWEPPSILSSDQTKPFSPLYKHPLYLNMDKNWHFQRSNTPALYITRNLRGNKEIRLIFYEVLFSKYKKPPHTKRLRCSLAALACLSPNEEHRLPH